MIPVMAPSGSALILFLPMLLLLALFLALLWSTKIEHFMLKYKWLMSFILLLLTMPSWVLFSWSM